MVYELRTKGWKTHQAQAKAVNKSSISSFRERTGYDENGNHLTYLRRSNTIASMPLAMDSLNYRYYKGANQLSNVRDGVSSNYSIRHKRPERK
jgi:hypothetical protein